MSISDGDWIEKKDQSQSGIRLIQTGNIGIGFFKDNSDKARYISEETFTKLKCTEVVNGDILISRLPDPVGRACIIPKLSTKNITAVDCSIVRLKQNILNQRFFIYYSQSDDYFSDISKQCSGSTRTRITKTRLSNIFIPIPPLSEQQRIVEILDAEFAKIDALKANAEKSLQAAKDLFQSVLTYELKPKKNWGTKSLKEIGKTQTGTTPKTSDKHNYGSFMPFIKPADINIDGLGGLNYDNEGLSEQGVAQGRLFDSYSILMVCIGATIGKVGYSLHPISCNQQINVLSPTKDYDYKYLYYYMSSPSFQFKVIKEGESAKATLPIINKTKWENLTITFPESLQEQNAIAIRLDEMNERCKALQENYRKTIALCEDLKQALLRKAFNGEL